MFSKDDGTEGMRNVSDPIREGAEGFLRVQYGAIFKIAIMLALVILLSYSMRPENKTETTGVGAVSPVLMGILASLSFCVGAGCSATAGYISMWVSASTNIRVCSAARRSYGECLEICFRGGAFSAVLCITLCVFGVSMLYFVLSVCFVNTGVVQPSGKSLHAVHAPFLFLYSLTWETIAVPMLMVGYGFGASFVALFMQLGGGIYTKAADVGADMVGKIEVRDPSLHMVYVCFGLFM